MKLKKGLKASVELARLPDVIKDPELWNNKTKSETRYIIRLYNGLGYVHPTMIIIYLFE